MEDDSGSGLLQNQLKLLTSSEGHAANEIPSMKAPLFDQGRKWPGPVTFDDDNPKKGYAYVTLTVPELQARGFIKALSKPQKNIKISQKISENSVDVEIIVDNNTEKRIYVYSKSLPEDIDPDLSKVIVKDGQLVLKMAKKIRASWAQHSIYFMERPPDISV